MKSNFLFIFGFALLVQSFSEYSAAFVGGGPIAKDALPWMVTFLPPEVAVNLLNKTAAHNLTKLNCTAAKISKTQILLAAHCVHPNGNYDTLKGDRLLIAWGVAPLNGIGGYKVVTVKNVIAHPSWVILNSKTKTMDKTVGKPGIIDLALIELVEPTPAIAAGQINTKPLNKGDVVLVGGMGLTNIASASRNFQYKASFKQVTQIENYFASVGAEDVIDVSKGSPQLSMGAPGDSGGPVDEYIEGKGYYIIGVNSFIKGYLELGRYPEYPVLKKQGSISTSFTRLDTEAAKNWLSQLLPLSTFISY